MTRSRRRPPEKLLLDEMFSPALAAALVTDGFDVVAVAGNVALPGRPDEVVAAWAVEQGRRLVTENVRDFVPITETRDGGLRLLCTSSRRFPRSRRATGPLLEALRTWLAGTDHPAVDWLS